MVGSKKITIELTMNEARIVAHALASSIPSKNDEMILFMLCNRITHKIDEAQSKNESL